MSLSQQFKTNFFRIIIVFIFIIFVIPFYFPVRAGGGRIYIESYSQGVTGTEGVNVQAWIRSEDYTRVVEGERAEFMVKSPREGDYCITPTNKSNNNGIVFGQCFASQPGQIIIYVHSLDTNYDSSDYVLYFNNPSPKPTLLPIKTIPILPTPTVSETPNLEPSPTNTIQFSPTSSPSFTPNSSPHIESTVSKKKNDWFVKAKVVISQFKKNFMALISKAKLFLYR